MTVLSSAVDQNRVSAIVGYEIKKSLQGIKAGNLPQKIGIFAEANTANQSGLPTSLNFTTAKEVGDIAGYGSPAYAIARILRPISGDLLGGIPTVLYPVAEAAGGVAATRTLTITGTATKNATHKLKIAGRNQLDGASYSFVVAKGDAAAEIAPKIIAAVNAILGAPVIATLAVADVALTAKWKGITSEDLNIVVEVDGNTAGITYGEGTPVAGAGVPAIATALTNLGDEWTTLLVNGIGSDSTILDALEAYNGDPNNRTGRYEPTVFKPLVALFGDNLSTVAEITAITDARLNEVTNVHCPSPNSLGFAFEAPANVAFIYGKIAQDTPQTDPMRRLYPDMPAAEDIGDYADPTKREQIIRVGGSNVKINGGAYEMLDFVTTYHPTDEPPTAAFFRYVRDLVGIDWNIKYGYTLLENINVVGKTIIVNGKTVAADDTISPVRWKGIINGYADDLEARALSADAAFMKESTDVIIGGTNANRLETSFRVKRTGTARVLSTTAETLYNFGG